MSIIPQVAVQVIEKSTYFPRLLSAFHISVSKKKCYSMSAALVLIQLVESHCVKDMKNFTYHEN